VRRPGLLAFVDNQFTDKGTGRSYLHVYRWLFAAKRDTARKVLEIGISQGGSIGLWHDYFQSADIYGIDIAGLDRVWDRIKGVPRIHLFPHQDAYDAKFLQRNFQNASIDIMIDDGPHSLSSMQEMIQLYLPLLKPDGILVIEDVQSPSWIQELHAVTPAADRQFIDTYNLQQMKGRYDDILFVINRGVNASTPAGMLALLNNSRSDKNTAHSYARTYQSLFYEKTTTAKNVMEIGIFRGGSIRLWHDYFRNSQVYGLDIMKYKDIWPQIMGVERITLYAERDAYNRSFVKEAFQKKNILFDIIIDDGPHSLQSMQLAIQYYIPVLASDGIFVIEDIGQMKWISSLQQVTPVADRKFVDVYDFRSTKGRLDDVMYVIHRAW
jgi:predicted O-methyltransferase YrrM